MGGARPHIGLMWTRFAIAGLLALLASPAAAQCLSIPDGTGATVLHCSDGRIGYQTTDPSGGVSGMLGGQMLTAPVDPTPPGLAGTRPAVGYVNPDLSMRTAPIPPPSIAPPTIDPAPPGRPFSTYPDPAGAGMRSQPGETPAAADPGATP
jgi:hypothetical protein